MRLHPSPNDTELRVLLLEALAAYGAHHDTAAWRLAHTEQNGPRTLALFTGPQGACHALLTEGTPPERCRVAAPLAPSELTPAEAPRPGSFLNPARPRFAPRPWFSDEGLFLALWPAPPGATRLALWRNGQRVEVPATTAGFLLTDWHSLAPVDRFEAVLTATGWQPVACAALPAMGTQLLEAYRSYIEAEEDAAAAPFIWAYDTFSMTGPAWFDAVTALIASADPVRDADLLTLFGAHIYGNDAPYYDRMEAELARGTLAPEALALVLSMEKPEFLRPEVQARHDALLRKCT